MINMNASHFCINLLLLLSVRGASRYFYDQQYSLEFLFKLERYSRMKFEITD